MQVSQIGKVIDMIQLDFDVRAIHSRHNHGTDSFKGLASLCNIRAMLRRLQVS